MAKLRVQSFSFSVKSSRMFHRKYWESAILTSITAHVEFAKKRYLLKFWLSYYWLRALFGFLFFTTVLAKFPTFLSIMG